MAHMTLCVTVPCLLNSRISSFLTACTIGYFSNRRHCSQFMNKISEFLAISASIIQGTGIGPVSYVVNASGLKAIFLLNKLLKYADDTYRIVPASQSHTIQNELHAIESWSLPHAKNPKIYRNYHGA